MRILHVNKFLHRRGGAEGYMEDVAAAQVAAGHEVAFFGMQHPLNAPQRFELHFPTQVEFEPPPPGAAAKVATLARMMWSTSAQRGIAAVIEEFRPDVAHLHNIYHQLSPSVLRPLGRRGVPALMTLHDYKLACPTYQFLDKGALCQACVGGGFRQAVRRRCKDGSLAASTAAAVELRLHTSLGAYDPVSTFLCPSRFLAGAMRRSGIAGHRLEVIPNFADTSSFPEQDAPGSGLVFAGRLSHEKGVDVLVEAVALLGAGTTLHVAGEGPTRRSLEELAQRVAPGQVVFHGRLPKAELMALVRAAAVAVVPSRWYENQPLAVLEAFACGVPVVASDLGGLPEMIRPGVDGTLVPHDDPRALASALRPLLADPQRCRDMGAAGRVRVQRDLSPEVHLKTLLSHYDNAVTKAYGTTTTGARTWRT